jgi:3-oxoacyl-[acyl-carrier-protein] synthase-1
MLCIRHGLLPAMMNLAEPDPKLHTRIVRKNMSSRVERVLSNSFGFAGNNCSLIFGAAS